MLISPHFDLAEFTTSQTAARLGRDVIAPVEVVRNLERLCFEILEPLRDMLARPIIINSGYRPDWLNKAVGGSETSAHLLGLAADIIAPGIVPMGVAGRVGMMYAAQIDGRPLIPTLDQCILEFGRWTHVGLRDANETPRGEFLTARSVNGRTVYEVGLRP